MKIENLDKDSRSQFVDRHIGPGHPQVAEMLSTLNCESLESLIDQVIADNPKAVAEATSGSKKAKKSAGFLMGQVMQRSKGQANPKVISEILNKKFS